MEKTITVKGTGRISVAPDRATVSFTIRHMKIEYEKAMEGTAEKLSALQDAMEAVGFDRKDLKTSSFRVRTEYESVCDKNGNYKTVFAGYACEQDLKAEFDFEQKRLSAVLAAAAKCISEPSIHIGFSVKDTESVKEALLEKIAADAKKKAEILARASGTEIGELVSIQYQWAEMNIVSPASCQLEGKCMRTADAMTMDITPENIDLEDSAAFVWKIG